MSLNPSSGSASLATMKVDQEFILNGAIVKAPPLKKLAFADKTEMVGDMTVRGKFSEGAYGDTKVSTGVPRARNASRLVRDESRAAPHVCDDLIFDSSTDSENSHTGELKRYKKNLIAKKNLQVDKSAQVQRDLKVCKTLTVGEHSQIRGNATVCGDLVVTGKIITQC